MIKADIKEKKMTLPLIHVLNKVSKKERAWLINSVKNKNKDKLIQLIDYHDK